MDLGAFSVSLSVRDIEASRAFYEKLGFTALGGDPAQNWLILRNGDHVIGLFQGMLEKNMLTFNPGWDQNAASVGSYTDVRELQRELKGRRGVPYGGRRVRLGTGQLPRARPGGQSGPGRPARLRGRRPVQIRVVTSTPGSFDGRAAAAAACRERSASIRIPMSSRYTGSGIRSTGETV